ncbi:hypothetical protein [Nocardia sp. NPDC047038]|uniref:hypothetical protein n=1 Tax=Nocardia sp. NPDC047038 TaxID=3154338 RepID=UPI0033DE99B6
MPFGGPDDGVSSAKVSPDGRSLYATTLLPRKLVRFGIHTDGILSGVEQRIGTDVNPIFPTITPDGRARSLPTTGR